MDLYLAYHPKKGAEFVPGDQLPSGKDWEHYLVQPGAIESLESGGYVATVNWGAGPRVLCPVSREDVSGGWGDWMIRVEGNVVRVPQQDFKALQRLAKEALRRRTLKANPKAHRGPNPSGLDPNSGKKLPKGHPRAGEVDPSSRTTRQDIMGLPDRAREAFAEADDPDTPLEEAKKLRAEGDRLMRRYKTAIKQVTRYLEWMKGEEVVVEYLSKPTRPFLHRVGVVVKTDYWDEPSKMRVTDRAETTVRLKKDGKDKAVTITVPPKSLVPHVEMVLPGDVPTLKTSQISKKGWRSMMEKAGS